jgi:hypothetical protein
MKRSDIQVRRQQVAYHLVKGMPEARIVELLGVDRSTITRDVAYIRNGARGWLDELARDGFIHEYRLALEKLKDHEFELQRLLDKADIAQKIQIIRALDENVRLYLELLGETPAVHAYKRAEKAARAGRQEAGGCFAGLRGRWTWMMPASTCQRSRFRQIRTRSMRISAACRTRGHAGRSRLVSLATHRSLG